VTASSVAALQYQQGGKSKAFIKIRVKRALSFFSILLMNCKTYRNSGSHYSLSRGEIGSIYPAKKSLKGILTTEISGDMGRGGSSADQIPSYLLVSSWHHNVKR